MGEAIKSDSGALVHAVSELCCTKCSYKTSKEYKRQASPPSRSFRDLCSEKLLSKQFPLHKQQEGFVRCSSHFIGKTMAKPWQQSRRTGACRGIVSFANFFRAMDQLSCGSC